MRVVFMKQANDNMQLFENVIIYVALDKFAFRAFNCLVYNRDISSFLITCYLRKLPNHYTLSNNIKSINLAIFGKRFLRVCIAYL